MAINGKKSIIGSAILEGGIEGLVMNFLHSFGQVAQEHTGEYLKSKIFGIGTNDEYLFLSACSYALENENVTSEELGRVLKVIDSYSSFQRSRIIGIIGKEEEDVTMENNGVKTSYKANKKGAKILAMLTKLNDDEIKNFLATSGASNSLEHKISETIKDSISKIKNGELAQDSKSFCSEKTWLEKWAESRKQTI